MTGAPCSIELGRDESRRRVVLKLLHAASRAGAIVRREEGDSENPDWIVVISPAGELTGCFLFDFEDYAALLTEEKARIAIIREALERRR